MIEMHPSIPLEYDLEVFMGVFYYEDFPSKLKEVHSPPEKLRYIGDISLVDRKTATVVGTRNPTEYGIKATYDIVKKLVDLGYVIASGFADGIDTHAHKAALFYGGKTIAVLGCGLSVDYPKKNSGLKERMKDSHLLLSEYEDLTEPRAFHFPFRNRIVSGLGDIVVVIEGEKKSGTMITATLAIEQGKTVYALPGSIYSSMSEGPNFLIREGAYPITNPSDMELHVIF